MKQLIIILTVIIIITPSKGYCQDYITIKFRKNQLIPNYLNSGFAKLKNGKVIPKLLLSFKDPSLNKVFNQFDIITFKKEYPTAEKFNGSKAEILNRVYRIEVADNIASLYKDLTHNNFIDIEEVLKCYNPKILSSVNPNDYYDTHDVTCYPNIAWSNGNLDLINVKRAWELTRGLPCVTIGIVDEDFQHHADIDAKVLNINSLSIEDASIAEHGTQVAGVAAAIPDNNFGTVGVGNQVTVRYYKGLTYDNILQAVTDGCKVINCSWGSSSPTLNPNPNEQMVIDMAFNAGVTVVAAAGNCNGINNCDDYFYPASYDHVISVSSVGYHFPVGSPQIAPFALGTDWIDCHDGIVAINGQQKQEYFQSNSTVDICAPAFGVETLIPVTSTWTNGINESYGTSFSSPTVAGVAALLYSINTNFTPTQVENFIEQNAVNVYNISYNQQYIGQLGAGRLDAGAAVTAAANSSPCFPNFTYINWYSGSQKIINNNYWQYLVSNKTITFKINSALVSPGATVEWEIISGDQTVDKTGTAASIQWGVDFTTMVGDKQRYDVYPLDVYVRQIKDCCASAFYKEKGYSPLVINGNASGPYPVYNCQGNVVFKDSTKLLPAYYKAASIYAGTFYGSNMSSVQIDPGFITDYIASKQIDIKAGFHAAPNSNGYFHALISSDCNYFNPYYTPCNNLPSAIQKPVANSQNTVVNVFSNNTQNNDLDLSYTAFPNPFIKFFNLNIVSHKNQLATIRIINSTGQTVYTWKNFLNKESIKTIKINLDNFSKGSYFVQVTGESTSLQSKLIIMY